MLGKQISVIFDGTTRLQDALTVIVRFIVDFVIQQYLFHFLTLAKSMTGEEIANAVEYRITSETVNCNERLS